MIHRDRKPANIKLRPDGTVKVLDFGLAKALEPSSPINSGLTAAPTITTPAQMTAVGTILGTASYMSPEQAKGAAADKRSDVWAFGCVLYEMLTGRLVFEGDSVAEVLGAIFKTEPDWNRLPSAVPEGIRRLLRRCLQKDRRLRQQSLGDARIEIEDALREPARAVSAAPRRRAWFPWTAAALATMAGLAEGLWLRRPPSEPAREVRFEVATPTTTDPTSLAVSPDGAKIVFVATSEGRRQLWLQSLATIETRPLVGTEDGLFPFWSPDSRSLAFFSGGRLNRLDLDNGLVRALAIAPNPLGGAWSRDGTVLFTPNYTGPIFRTTATGGDAQPLTRDGDRAGEPCVSGLPARQSSFPLLRHRDNGEPGRVRRRTGRPIRLAAAGRRRTCGIRAEPGAVRSPGNGVRAGDRPGGSGVARQSGRRGRTGTGRSDVEARRPVGVAIGHLRISERRFRWRTAVHLVRSIRAGTWEGLGIRPCGVADVDFFRPATSLRQPAGERQHRHLGGGCGAERAAARDVRSGGGSAGRSVPRRRPDRVQLEPQRRVRPLFTSAAGNGSEDLLLATPQNKSPGDWSSDGRFVLFRSPGKTTGFDLWALPMDGDGKAFPVVQTNFEERDGQFSPDGNWMAYQSNESGRFEIYVQPFPKGSREPISSGGGAQVRWRPDGRELFYIALDGRLMAVPTITYADGGRRIEAGVPVPLFTTRVGGALQGPNQQQYVVWTDGQRFLMSTVTETRSPAITVVLNWKPGAAER